MAAKLNLSRLAEVCTGIANDVAEGTGFVSVRNLLSRFNVELIIRPLLVEGMLAELGLADGESSRWAILIDSEKYPITEAQVAAESVNEPLPARARFTIAHELVHSLAFRPTQFGMDFQFRAGDQQSRAAFVQAVETETDKLSSLLLWPSRAIEQFLREKEKSLTVDRLVGAMRNQGISRYALVSRLRTFQSEDKLGLLERNDLRNVAIGIGEWGQGGSAVLRKWPLFLNFDRNVIPDMLLRIAREDRSPASRAFPDPKFLMNGGTEPTTRVLNTAEAGGGGARKSVLRVTTEQRGERAGSSFLYVVTQENPADVLELTSPRAT